MACAHVPPQWCMLPTFRGQTDSSGTSWGREELGLDREAGLGWREEGEEASTSSLIVSGGGMPWRAPVGAVGSSPLPGWVEADYWKHSHSGQVVWEEKEGLLGMSVDRESRHARCGLTDYLAPTTYKQHGLLWC